MSTLADYVSVVERFARSVNVDRDCDRVEPLNGYIITHRAIDVLERLAETASSCSSGGAWSLTGPYGSGKSSLAILIDAVFGPPSAIRDFAWRLTGEASPSVLESIRQAHYRYSTLSTGFNRGLVTAQRESIGETLLRALHMAVIRRYGKIPSTVQFSGAKALKSALEDVKNGVPTKALSPTAVIDIARCLAETAPLLIVVDEFGKNLETIRENKDTDLYLLQQIAEVGQGSGLPIFILTLQHQSFEDYFAGTRGTQRREWGKIQGRFEDIAYINSTEQSRKLIGSAFDIKNNELKPRIDNWACTQIESLRSLGITDIKSPDVISACYPLHPLTTLVLSELCNRFGQNERTMFSFLASRNRASVATFISNTRLPKGKNLPSVGLDSIYDYFVSDSTFRNNSNDQTSRWVEITTCIRDIHGLSRQELKLVKTIAVLNLISTSGTIRASRKILSFADNIVRGNLKKLESVGIVTYREFADEYRIWQGSDIDIKQLYSVAYQRAENLLLIEILKNIDQPSSVVAARHSAESHTLRVFSRRYIGDENVVAPVEPFSAYDGEVLLVVGTQLPKLEKWNKCNKPTVAVIPRDIAEFDCVVRQIAAIRTVLDDPTVTNDWVARGELNERLAHIQGVLEHAFHTTFSGHSARSILLDDAEGIELQSGRGSAPLSEALDIMFSSTPIFRNEMINRTTLTTQGSKARRVVLQAMIENESEPDLGLVGDGPEVSIFRAVLKHTGLQGRDERNDTMTFRKPTDISLLPAWRTIEHELKRARFNRVNLAEIHAILLSPPIGMKAGVVPIFVTASLLAYRDEIAIYEHGTFKPVLTDVLSERMVKNPGQFDIKHFANTSGARLQVIEVLAEYLNLKPGFRKHRVANVLTVVGYLVSVIHKLDKYTLRTNNLDSTTIKVRDTILSAIEPDKLIFDGLPNSVNLPTIPADANEYKSSRTFAKRIKSSVDNLIHCHDRLLSELLEFLLATSRESNRKSVAGFAASLENQVLHPTIKAFTGILAQDSFKDMDWVNAVATVVLKKAPTEWTDDDLVEFKREISQQMAAFRRLVALHAEYRVDGNGPFNSLRITVTESNGNEYIDLVSIDDNVRNEVTNTLNNVLDKLTKILGSTDRAQSTLLALLSERLLSESKQHSCETEIQNIGRKRQNG